MDADLQLSAARKFSVAGLPSGRPRTCRQPSLAPLPRVITGLSGCMIVAATGMCQGSDFHSSRATALWKLSACSATAVRVSVNKQAFRCYEYDPLTFRCP
jgi:hypothetical protein